MSSMKPKSRPKYWRSLSELEGDSEFHEFIEREFRSPTEQTPLSSQGRRRFMQLMGASFALAGCRWQEEKLLPHTSQPAGLIPGVPVNYATVMDVGGVATGLLVKSYDGRPIKIEGNALDSVSQGGTGTFHQASILGLYDPDRSSKTLQGSVSSTADAFDRALLDAFALAVKKGGAGFFVLSQASSSPTLARLRAELLKQAPLARWVAYEAADAAGPRAGTQLAFGKALTPMYRVENADVIVALDSDFINSTFPGGMGNARAMASRRDPDQGKMSRVYSLEASLTEVGSLADHRVAVAPSKIAALAAYLDALVSAGKAASGAQTAPDEAAVGGAHVKKVLDVVAKDLLAHAGKSLVVVGSGHPPEVHALVHRINFVLGNIATSGSVGSPLQFRETGDTLAGGVDELASLVADMEGGKVGTLLMLGGNPAYDAPADIGFESALSKVPSSFHVGLYVDETASLCKWHTPLTHFLEAWGDARALDGSYRIAQPLIESVLGGRSDVEILAKLLHLTKQDGQSVVRDTLGLTADKLGSGADKAFRKAVHDGFTGETATALEVELQPLGAINLPASTDLEVIFEVDPALYDGRFANNGWLQALPHPLSQLAWDNAALVAPETAKKHGLKDAHPCTVTLDGRSVTLPCLVAPGQAEGTLMLALGYGREQAGVVGGLKAKDVKSVGANTYAIRTSKAPHFALGAQVKTAGERVELAVTQHLWAIDAVGKSGEDAREDVLVREATLGNYQEFKKQPHPGHGAHGDPHPGDIKGKVHHPPKLNLWNGPVSYDGHKWGMAVDLNKCSGCSSCIIACQSENNIAVVGKDEVSRGRELTWLRVERYYKGDDKSAEVRQQPVMCQQCESAPCEQVCPVGATMHSAEGLNDMVYNRCIGTRYCSNNCPYKVRRFNYRNYNLEFYGTTPYSGTDDPRAKLRAMAFNPEVTVRSRGVMEKCTFCVQRIQNTKIQAKNNKRPIEDGEIKTACEQACPTGAIIFGDLNDKTSRVQAAHNKSRAYELLQELNNRPRVNYLARISNPHPELSTQDGHSEHH